MLVNGSDSATSWPEWLNDYAGRVCSGLVLPDEKELKGKGHLPRIDLGWGQRFNELLKHLPKFKISKRNEKPHFIQSQGKWVHGYHCRQCVLQSHFEVLESALMAVGFDLERTEVVCPDAMAIGSTWWALNREPLPPELYTIGQQMTEHAMAARDVQEQRDIVRSTRS